MKVLLIGSEGYVGSYLKYALSSKYQFECVDTNWFHGKGKPKDYKDLTRDYIRSFESVVLLAGHSSVRMCADNMLSSFRNNVQNFLELLEKLHEVKFIYASSSSVYGNTNGHTVGENYVAHNPTNYYDITKQIIDIYSSKSEVEYYALRFGTVNGWSPHLRKDIMINAMVHSAFTKRKIDLYSKKINRAILGIKDLASALEAILDCKKDNRGVYNLASFNSTAHHIAHKVGEIMGVPVIENDDSGVGIYDFSINTDKFEKTFNYQFSESIESIVESLKDNLGSCELGDRNEAVKYEV